VVEFATEFGGVPACDRKMLEGLTRNCWYVLQKEKIQKEKKSESFDYSISIKYVDYILISPGSKKIRHPKIHHHDRLRTIPPPTGLGNTSLLTR
jgi:hypothetical protein